MDLRQAQAPIKERYREEPEAAKITPEQLEELHKKAERYCTVLQTLKSPPPIESSLQT